MVRSDLSQAAPPSGQHILTADARRLPLASASAGDVVGLSGATGLGSLDRGIAVEFLFHGFCEP